MGATLSAILEPEPRSGWIASPGEPDWYRDRTGKSWPKALICQCDRSPDFVEEKSGRMNMYILFADGSVFMAGWIYPSKPGNQGHGWCPGWDVAMEGIQARAAKGWKPLTERIQGFNADTVGSGRSLFDKGCLYNPYQY